MEAAEHALTAIRHYRYQASAGKVIANLSASIGIALYPFHGNDLPSLLSNVDIAMYQAKDLGRNRHALFDQDSGALRNTHKRVHWAKKLRDALDEDRLILFAQPVVRLSDRQVMHHEILLRIRDENGAYTRAGQFHGNRRNTGHHTGNRSAGRRKSAELHRAPWPCRHESPLFRESVARRRFPVRTGWTSFMRLLATSGVQPNQLVFEITETAALSEIDVTLKFIRRLKEMGCRIRTG